MTTNDTAAAVVARISRAHLDDDAVRLQLTAYIATALNNERERCAGVADDEAEAWTKAAAEFNPADPLRVQARMVVTSLRTVAAAMREEE